VKLERFRAHALLLMILSLLGSSGCNGAKDAIQEQFDGLGAVLTVDNTCKFDVGKFNDTQCRYRITTP